MPSIPTLLTAIFSISSTATAHLAILNPPQFRTPWNPQNGGNIDVQNKDPLFPDGRNYPCMNGHIGMTEASSVATWAAGSNQKMTIEGETFRKFLSAPKQKVYLHGPRRRWFMSNLSQL